MYDKQPQQLWLPLTSSAEGSHARTCPARERAQALLEAARVCGLSSSESSGNYSLVSWWLRTYRPGRSDGWTMSWPGWSSRATLRFRSLCRRRMSALGTFGDGCLLLPTLSATTYGSNRGGAAGREGKDRPSLETMAKRRVLLPTMGAADAKMAKHHKHLLKIFI